MRYATITPPAEVCLSDLISCSSCFRFIPMTPFIIIWAILQGIEPWSSERQSDIINRYTIRPFYRMSESDRSSNSQNSRATITPHPIYCNSLLDEAVAAPCTSLVQSLVESVRSVIICRAYCTRLFKWLRHSSTTPSYIMVEIPLALGTVVSDLLTALFLQDRVTLTSLAISISFLVILNMRWESNPRSQPLAGES